MSHVEWTDAPDDEGEWIFHSKYNKKTVSANVKKHFKAGLSMGSLCGSLSVSPNTITNWMKHRPEFKKVVDEHKSLAPLKTDQLHVQCGETGEGNATVLNRRASHFLSMHEKQIIDNNTSVTLSEELIERAESLTNED